MLHSGRYTQKCLVFAPVPRPRTKNFFKFMEFWEFLGNVIEIRIFGCRMDAPPPPPPQIIDLTTKIHKLLKFAPSENVEKKKFGSPTVITDLFQWILSLHVIPDHFYVLHLIPLRHFTVFCSY